MNYTAEQLDVIVRMVVERLRAMPENAKSNSRVTLRETQPPTNGTPRKLAKFHDVAGGTVDKSTLTLAEKVITTEALADRLNGIARVIVTKGSVVTPAARDWLRERNIKLQIGGKPVVPANCPLVIGSDQRSIASSAVAGESAAECLQYEECWQQLLAKVIDRISDSRRIGVVITASAAAAACRANRNSNVRAMVATDLKSIADDRRQIGANLLIVDPTGRGVHAVRQLIAAFARDGYLDPPRGWEA